MKRDFGWGFKNIFFYFKNGIEFSCRSSADIKSLRQYYKKKFNKKFVEKFNPLIRQRADELLAITKSTFGSNRNFKAKLPDFYQAIYGLMGIFQLPELAQIIIPEADEKLHEFFGLARDVAARKLIKAEKIWRKNLGKKIGLSSEQALMLLPDEVFKIANGEPVPKDLKQRKRAAIIFSNGKGRVLWNKKADEFFQKEVGKNIKSPSILAGQTAYPGVVKGKVYRAFAKEEFKKMPKEAILVCSTTRYDIVQYLSKARAIVADQGGITSPASITARELKIPTVVGMRYATEYFKTGNRIEVDAKKGIIRKLE